MQKCQAYIYRILSVKYYSLDGLATLLHTLCVLRKLHDTIHNFMFNKNQVSYVPILL